MFKKKKAPKIRISLKCSFVSFIILFHFNEVIKPFSLVLEPKLAFTFHLLKYESQSPATSCLLVSLADTRFSFLAILQFWSKKMIHLCWHFYRIRAFQSVRQSVYGCCFNSCPHLWAPRRSVTSISWPLRQAVWLPGQYWPFNCWNDPPQAILAGFLRAPLPSMINSRLVM